MRAVRVRVRVVLRVVRKGLVFLAGLILVVLGFALFVVPGHLLLVAAGLAVWATEFAWASRLLARMRERIATVRRKYRKRRAARAAAEGQPAAGKAQLLERNEEAPR